LAGIISAAAIGTPIVSLLTSWRTFVARNPFSKDWNDCFDEIERLLAAPPASAMALVWPGTSTSFKVVPRRIYLQPMHASSRWLAPYLHLGSAELENPSAAWWNAPGCVPSNPPHCCDNHGFRFPKFVRLAPPQAPVSKRPFVSCLSPETQLGQDWTLRCTLTCEKLGHSND